MNPTEVLDSHNEVTDLDTQSEGRLCRLCRARRVAEVEGAVDTVEAAIKSQDLESILNQKRN